MIIKKFIIFTLILLGSCHMHVAYGMNKKNPKYKNLKTIDNFIEKLKDKVIAKIIKEQTIDGIFTAEVEFSLEIDNTHCTYRINLLLSPAIPSAKCKTLNLDIFSEYPDEYLTEKISRNPDCVYDNLYYAIDNIDTLEMRNGFE